MNMKLKHESQPRGGQGYNSLLIYNLQYSHIGLVWRYIRVLETKYERLKKGFIHFIGDAYSHCKTHCIAVFIFVSINSTNACVFKITCWKINQSSTSSQVAVFSCLPLGHSTEAVVGYSKCLAQGLLSLQSHSHVSHMQLARQCSPQSSANLCVLRGVMEL